MLLAMLAPIAGCANDARLADHAVPHVVVKPVTEYGVELGTEANPKQVAYVLLRAIRDDVKAGSDAQARQTALGRQFGVCDADYIFELYRTSMGGRAVYGRDEWVYKKVHLWAPTLAYYVDSFDVDLTSAESGMVAGITSRSENWPGQTIQVQLQARDPQGEPGADVVVRVLLHKHPTGLWRAFHVGFVKTRRLRRATSQPSAAAHEAPPS